MSIDIDHGLYLAEFHYFCIQMRFLLVILIIFPFLSKAQDIDGKWSGTFVQYIHNTYDVELILQKLPAGNTFSARLKITDGRYFGEFQISGFICEKHNLEISTIILVRENENSTWIDCLDGTFDLNDDENELTFGDTWLQKYKRNNTCKLKFIQKDMFQCLRSAYFRKVKYADEIAEFEKTWNDNNTQKTKPASEEKGKLAQAEKPVLPKETKSETKIVEKNEDREPVIDTFVRIKQRRVIVKDEIEVSSADITIEYWDRYTEDGDSIDLFLNKNLILENERLTKVKKTLKVHLNQINNYLVVHAVNLGTEPPNTASVTVKDGKKIQNVSLTSDLRTSGALKITLKKSP